MAFLEWSAASVALLGAWSVASVNPAIRRLGFAAFLLSNSMWIIWGSVSGAWGLVAMQALFCCASLRGIVANRIAHA